MILAFDVLKRVTHRGQCTQGLLFAEPDASGGGVPSASPTTTTTTTTTTAELPLLLMSEGYWGRSRVLSLDWSGSSARVVREQAVQRASLFAEGAATTLDGVLHVLTYRAGVVLEFDAKTLEPRDSRFDYDGEGWGLAFSSAREQFVMSNGSAHLTFRSRDTFAIVNELKVTLPDGTAVNQLNEMEILTGTNLILIHQWFAERILAVDLDDGIVRFILDTRVLNVAPSDMPSSEKLCGPETGNGIAYCARTNRLVVFGKYWKEFVEISFEFEGKVFGGGNVVGEMQPSYTPSESESGQTTTTMVHTTLTTLDESTIASSTSSAGEPSKNLDSKTSTTSSTTSTTNNIESASTTNSNNNIESTTNNVESTKTTTPNIIESTTTKNPNNIESTTAKTTIISTNSIVLESNSFSDYSNLAVLIFTLVLVSLIHFLRASST